MLTRHYNQRFDAAADFIWSRPGSTGAGEHKPGEPVDRELLAIDRNVDDPYDPRVVLLLRDLWDAGFIELAPPPEPKKSKKRG